MWSNFNGRLKELFAPITLTQLNAQAAFLDRIDTKFIVSEDELIFLIEELKKDFYVLDIGGKSVFEYDSIYMDTEDYLFYNQHQAKKIKSRTKVRTREYVDAGIAFFEYKQKQGKSIRKFRYQFDLENHGKMDSESEKFFEGLYMSFYDGEKAPVLTPSSRTHYNRLTLCSKDNSERVTIDFNIELENLRGSGKKKLENMVIIESKATSKDCLSHKIMAKHNIDQAKGCSKYCMSLLYTGVMRTRWVFEKTMKKADALAVR